MQGSNIWNADNLWNKAISEFNSGQKSLARRTFKACLELARPGSLVFGYSLLYIGRCYENHKKVIYLKLAVELLHKLESDAASDLFAELSLAYLSIGRLSKAIKTSLRALHASKTDPQKLAKCKMLEAEILLFCGGAEDALNLLQSWDVVSNLNGLMIELRFVDENFLSCFDVTLPQIR
jgi:tetratricopeptide (TPR) repeat protein